MINDLTLRQWLNDWAEVYKKPNLKPKSLYNIQSYIRLHIPDDIKDKPITAITPFDIQKALNTIPTTRMRSYVYDVYGDSLRRAYVLGMLTRNPMDNVDKIKHNRVIGKALSKKELSQFLVSINLTKYRLLYLFYLYTGARRGEAFATRWKDVDFDNNRITINGTKTDKALRTIPLFPELRDILKTMPKGKSEYLFNFSVDRVSKRFKQLCPAHKLHDLRHTFATRCLECGISIKVLQLWLGHSRLETTSSIYIHVLDSFNRSEAEKFKLF